MVELGNIEGPEKPTSEILIFRRPVFYEPSRYSESMLLDGGVWQDRGEHEGDGGTLGHLPAIVSFTLTCPKLLEFTDFVSLEP